MGDPVHVPTPSQRSFVGPWVGRSHVAAIVALLCAELRDCDLAHFFRLSRQKGDCRTEREVGAITHSPEARLVGGEAGELLEFVCQTLMKGRDPSR